MRYLNTKTGIEFETPCECKGADLIEVKEEKTEKKPVAKKRKAADKDV